MTTISETINSESINWWNDYSAAADAVKQEETLQYLGAFAFSVSCIINLKSYIPFVLIEPMAICLIVFPIFTVLAAYNLRDKMYRVPYLASIISGMSIATTIFTRAYPLVRFGLPVFGMMCLYSAYLQTVGLTKARFLGLCIGKLKEIIASNEPKNECVIIEKIVKNGDYTYIYVNSEEMSMLDIHQLLSFAYQHKKVLCFSSLIDPTPTKLYTYYVYDQYGMRPVHQNIPLTPQEIWNRVASGLYFSNIIQAFSRSVDYLIRCKLQNTDLDTHFINEQLKFLSPAWGSKSWFTNHSVTLRLKPNLSLKNGNPVIITRVGELAGMIDVFKIQLYKHFNSIELVQDSSPPW